MQKHVTTGDPTRMRKTSTGSETNINVEQQTINLNKDKPDKPKDVDVVKETLKTEQTQTFSSSIYMIAQKLFKVISNFFKSNEKGFEYTQQEPDGIQWKQDNPLYQEQSQTMKKNLDLTDKNVKVTLSELEEALKGNDTSYSLEENTANTTDKTIGKHTEMLSNQNNKGRTEQVRG